MTNPEYNLTDDERELLADIALYSPEVKERELSASYLEWGRYLVEHGLVSEDIAGETNGPLQIRKPYQISLAQLRQAILRSQGIDPELPPAA